MGLHHVVTLTPEGCVLLDVAIPVHVFGYHGDGRYRLTLAGHRRGPVRTSTGVVVQATAGLRALASADTVVVPGYDEVARPPPPPVLASLRAAAARGARLLSICTGAFALAYAGLLDGRRATTHWALAAQLAERFPAVTVDPNVLYVDDGAILTSAGVAAGLDLCLHVVRRDHGAAVAAGIARHTVVAPHRHRARRDVAAGHPRLGPRPPPRTAGPGAAGPQRGGVATDVRAALPRRDRHHPAAVGAAPAGPAGPGAAGAHRPSHRERGARLRVQHRPPPPTGAPSPSAPDHAGA